MAETLKQRGVYVTGVFNNDIVGNIHGGNDLIESTYVRVFSEAYAVNDTGKIFRERNMLGFELDGPSRTLARYIKDAAERYMNGFRVNLIFRRDRFLRGGDQTSFLQMGIPAVRFTEAKENFRRQHQGIKKDSASWYGDILEGFNAGYCKRIAQANLAALASLASAPASPEQASIVNSELSYSTTLRWHVNHDGSVSGSYVLARPTDTPYWHTITFTSDTTMTVPFSKDDYIFGIQSVNPAGDRSLVVIPRPVR